MEGARKRDTEGVSSVSAPVDETQHDTEGVSSVSAPVDETQHDTEGVSSVSAPVDETQHDTEGVSSVSAPVDETQHDTEGVSLVSAKVDETQHDTEGVSSVSAPVDETQHYTEGVSSVSAPVNETQHDTEGVSSVSAPVDETQHDTEGVSSVSAPVDETQHDTEGVSSVSAPVDETQHDNAATSASTHTERDTDNVTTGESQTDTDIDILKNQINALESMVHKNKKTIAVLGDQLDKSESKLHRQEVQVERLQVKLKASKSKHEDCASSLKAYRNKTLYQSMRCKLRRYKQQVSLDSQSSHASNIAHWQSQLKSVKKSLANQRQLTRLHLLQKIECVNEQSKLKDLPEVDAQLSLLKSDAIVTRTDDRGKPYTENVEKCIMHLMGECDVPSTKCSNVIQAVSKWIFQKEVPLSQLPLSSTCVNMRDCAHVLSKYQVAETIQQSERIDLHSDGTSRDHKKIIGQQLNCGHGILSTGWSSVATQRMQLHYSITPLLCLMNFHMYLMMAPQKVTEKQLRKPCYDVR